MTGLILPLAQTVSLKKSIWVSGSHLMIQQLEVGVGLLTGTLVFLSVPQIQRFYWIDLSKVSSMLALFEAKIRAALTVTRIFDGPCFLGWDISTYREIACACYDPNHLAKSTLHIRGKWPNSVYLKDFMLNSGGSNSAD